MTPTSKMAELSDRLVALEAKRRLLKDNLDQLTEEVKNIGENMDLLAKTEQVLLHVSTKVLGQSTKTIDKLVTAGLRIVFEDQLLEFRTAIDKYRGKTSIKFMLLEGGRNVPIMDSYGGGVLVVAGVLLRVVTIITLDLKRVLFLDETFSHLSDQYIPNASRLMKKLCQELDFTICMVTHQPEFATHADLHYKAQQKGAGTTFTRV